MDAAAKKTKGRWYQHKLRSGDNIKVLRLRPGCCTACWPLPLSIFDERSSVSAVPPPACPALTYAARMGSEKGHSALPAQR
jgi:hypothetical protein